MYQTLIFYHSVFRWLVVLSLGYSIFRAYRGYVKGSVFSKTDNALRHWTATIAHLQLVLGILVYIQSPVTAYFWKHVKEGSHHTETLFFGLIHALLMLFAIVIVTIGSALTKRRVTDGEKFRTQLLWFSIALCIIFLAIPWPFSPLASRPYIR